MSRSVFAITALALLSSSVLAQTIVRGPIFNPATGARYYAVQAASWTAANSFAIGMGCNMVTVADASENAWLMTNFGVPLSNAKLFIGLSDSAVEGTLAWAFGSSSFSNWAPGQPNNDANRDYTVVNPPSGVWSLENATFTPISIIKTAGAVRIPQEYPTFAAAYAALPNSGTGTILVAPGTYPVDTTLVSPPGMGILIQKSGPGQVNILAPTSGPAFVTSNNFTLRDVTIRGRGNMPLLTVQSGLAEAFNLHLEPLAGSNSDVVQIGGSAAFRVDSGAITGGGAFLQCTNGSSAYVRSTLIDSAAAVTSGSGAVIRIYGSTITRCTSSLFSAGNTTELHSCIVWGNSGVINPANFISHATDCQLPVPGFLNISIDPRFVNSASGNFNLLPGSPCIDRGSIDTVTSWIPTQYALFLDSSQHNRLNDDLSSPNTGEGFPPCDMGAFEFQGNSCPADFNLDGVVDFFDYLDFVDAFSIGC